MVSRCLEPKPLPFQLTGQKKLSFITGVWADELQTHTVSHRSHSWMLPAVWPNAIGVSPKTPGRPILQVLLHPACSPQGTCWEAPVPCGASMPEKLCRVGWLPVLLRPLSVLLTDECEGEPDHLQVAFPSWPVVFLRQM